MAYDSRWRLEFDQLRRQCIREPPPLTRHRLQVGDVENYTRLIKPFHKRWGQWWLWGLLFPVLMVLVCWRRLQQCAQTCMHRSKFKNLYRSRKVPSGFVSFLSVVHVVLRCILNLAMIAGDFRRLFQRKAIWREDSRYAVLATPLNKTDTDLLKFNIRFVRFVSMLGRQKNRLLKRIKGHQKTQVRRARISSFVGGLGIYYYGVLNLMMDSSDDILISLLAATAMIVWPIPIGLLWMIFVYKICYPFITRVFYEKSFWIVQFPGGYFGEPRSERRLLWYLSFLSVVVFGYFALS